MKKGKKFLAFIMTLVMILTAVPIAGFALESNASKSTIAIGDTITMGKYNDEPIVWRCVDIDENGPLMLSEKVLCFKSFDAKGNYGNYYRNTWGSNFWETSSLRHWLNSSGTVDWSNRISVPSTENVCNGYNAYDKEQGFLSCFSESELKKIKIVTQKTYLNSLDKAYADGGTGEYDPKGGSFDVFSDHLKTYGVNKWYYNSTDRVFILGAEQVAAVYENLGTDALMAKATDKAKENDNSGTEFSDSYCDYWIRLPINTGMSYENIAIICGVGAVGGTTALSADIGTRKYMSVGVRPAFYLDGDASVIDTTYAATYGWCLANDRNSFGYDDNYVFPLGTLCKLYGYNVCSLIYDVCNQFEKNRWGGNCFGLSLLSLAQYYDKVDMRKFFQKSGEYLYDFGYEEIYTAPDGRPFFSVKGNDDIIEFIEREHWAQESLEILECKVFDNDNYYSNLINFLMSEKARPLLLTLKYKGDNGRHAMVITNDVKPIKEDGGWYKIPLYDSNAPVDKNSVITPFYTEEMHRNSKPYEFDQSWLRVNTETSEWELDAYTGTERNNYYKKKENGENGRATIEIYDVDKLSKDFFSTGLFSRKLTLNLFKLQKIYFIPGNGNFEILNGKNEVILKIVDGIVKQVAENCELDCLSGDNEGSTPAFSFSTDYEDLIIKSSDSAGIFALSKKYAMAANLNGSYDAQLDFTNGSIKANGLNSNGDTVIAIQDLESNRCIKAEGESSKDKYVSLQIRDDNPNAIVDSNSDKFKYEDEGFDKEKSFGITLNGSAFDGDVAYVKLPSVTSSYMNQTALLGFTIDPYVNVQSVKWSYDKWSATNPEANIESPDSAETVIRPNGKGIGARSTWVKLTVTDTDGNVYEKTVKVRFYKWDWQRK